MKFAKKLIEEGQEDLARERLKKVIDDTPDTKGAKDAAALLKAMDKAAKPADGKERETQDKTNAPAKDKEKAAGKVTTAKRLLEDAKEAHRQGDRQEEDRLRQGAKALLQEVVDKCPGTPAADEAKKLLDEL